MTENQLCQDCSYLVSDTLSVFHNHDNHDTNRQVMETQKGGGRLEVEGFTFAS